MIGKLLRVMRLHKGFSLEELSSITGIDRDLLLQYEDSSLEPDFEKVCVIAKACGYETRFIRDDDVITVDKEI
ncbi:MAG: helix-turn-helix transcriptional regulator [Bacilli bacterium]|nr:helix-turn-helix transcriptional regulator [Bacilli bacterium]